MEGQPFRLQVDDFSDRQHSRLWLNYGEIDLVDREELSLNFKPGILARTDGKIWAGGFLQGQIPALRLTTNWKSAWGEAGDRHLWFANVNLTDEVGIGHVLFMQDGYEPDSYLGPAITLGDLYLWGGPSLTKEGSWAVNLEAPILRF